MRIVSAANADKLWRVIECRDQSLGAVHGSLARQTLEKENEIHKMANVLAEKEQEIVSLASNLSDREKEIVSKEAEIRRLAEAASERLELIKRQQAELESISRSSEYRFGYLALNPWQVLKKRLFRDTSFR